MWKRYKYNGVNTNIYISNLGCVACFSEEEAKNAFCYDIYEKLIKNGEAVKYVDLKNSRFIKSHILDLTNKQNGYQVDLWVQNYNSIYRIVAELFLEKQYPDGSYKYKSWCVHHIDNNSYNNSVTNLIYVPTDMHNIYSRKLLHPMSY